MIHIERCNENTSLNSCQLNDHHKRFSFMSSTSKFTKSKHENHLCLLECSFDLSISEHFHQVSFHRPVSLDLSVEFTNKTLHTIPRTHISLYDCERMASNCTSCIQLDSSFGCIWCNNMCRLKNETAKGKLMCPHSQECLLPIIQTIEPLLLPINGGSLVTIKGKNFDLFNLSIRLADVSCRVIEEESSNNKIICQSGDAGIKPRSGFAHLKFGLNGPRVFSRQTISYIYPAINLIEPLMGIESGGTILTIHGENLTLGNSHISISIGNYPCHLLSITRTKIQCETNSFPRLIINEQQPIKLIFDRQTTINPGHMFTIAPNPVLYRFDRYYQFQSFMSGGRHLIVHGDNFHAVQNVRLEFKRTIFVSPLFQNQTVLIFLTPSIQELNLNKENDHQYEIEIILHLDHFNRTSSLMYVNDPIIYELEPMLRTYTNELVIQGVNLTAVGHTKNDINVLVGCDPCIITHLQPDRIICQPPLYRPNKYSKTDRLCYDSEHPWITVMIDNVHSHVGYMIYPKKLIILAIIGGCLLTILSVILIALIIVCIKMRCAQRKSRRHYLYGNGMGSNEIEKEPYADNLINRTYQKLQPMEANIVDSTPLTTIPIRSYINYLQLCYYYYSYDSSLFIPPYDIPKLALNPEVTDHFQLLFENNDLFIECLSTTLLKSNNKRNLNNFILTQRYHLKKLLKFNNDLIFFNTCLLLSYDGFLINQINSLIFQLYYQLKCKIYSGPIDAIEQTCSYYSLNNTTILNDQSTVFNSIQLIIHVDFSNADDLLLLNVTCLTCDTITQVKQKILNRVKTYKNINPVSINECQLYLLTNVKSNNHSFSSSSCSSSTTSSSNVPLAKKFMLTQFFFNRTNKYSTTTTTASNESYRDSVSVLLNDIDSTNEQINHCKRFNTLQHYGILNDGYEFKIVLPNKNQSSNYVNQMKNTFDSKQTLRRTSYDCQYCATDLKNTFSYITSLPLSPDSIGLSLKIENDQTRYFHLLNHTYEEIGECGHLLMDSNQSKTYRLFETKSIIHPILINLIETLFTNFLHSDSYLSELIEQHTRLLHVFYGHFIPFILKNMNCLLDITIEKCLNSSLDILANIFRIACSCQTNEDNCSLCNELKSNNKANFNLNIQNCTLLFADEIQRVRLHYSNIERRLNNKNSSSEYSSTNTGVTKKFELDQSIINELLEYLCSHVEEIADLLKSQSTDNKTLIIFFNLVQMYQSTGRA